MSATHRKKIELYYGDDTKPATDRVVALLYAPHVVICSQYADLRDEQDKLVATITWTTPVKCREA